MAEEDDSQKTEDPSSRKLDKGRERGQVAQSQDVAHWGILVAGAAGIMFLAPWMMRRTSNATRMYLESAATIPADFENLRRVLSHLMLEMLIVTGPFLGLLFLVAIAIHVAQTGLIWSPSKLELDPEKISPLKGLKRLFSGRTLVEFAKNVLKLTIVGVAAFGMTLPLLNDLELMPAKDLLAAMDRSYGVAIRLSIAALAILTLIAAIDFAYQKFMFLRQMRMTKQEVRDEHKQTEGDPQVKARIRKLRLERARRRMMAAVPKADVVVTNPTHFAIALEYKMESMPAPKVVAKGMDSLALKIREVAEANEVPIVENPPLARALYDTVELDEEIPTEHYKAVAEIIGYVMRLKGKLK